MKAGAGKEGTATGGWYGLLSHDQGACGLSKKFADGIAMRTATSFIVEALCSTVMSLKEAEPFTHFRSSGLFLSVSAWVAEDPAFWFGCSPAADLAPASPVQTKHLAPVFVRFFHCLLLKLRLGFFCRQRQQMVDDMLDNHLPRDPARLKMRK